MPSDKMGGRGRSSICDWRVKAGKKEVYRGDSKFDCSMFMKSNPKVNGKKCKLVPPN